MIPVQVLDTVCIVGAQGCIGSFFQQLFSPNAGQMRLIDVAYSETQANIYKEDLSQTSEEKLREIFFAATVVIFAVASDVFMRILEQVIAFLPENCVIVDTTSTKIKINTFYDNLLLNQVNKPQILSLDPLFRPGASRVEKSISFFTKYEKQPLKDLVCYLTQAGYEMVATTPQEHDSALSIIQVNVHALVLMFGKTIVDSNIPMERLLKYATPPFRLLFLLLHRMASGVPEVYWDIQLNNVFGEKMREVLKKNLDYLNQLVIRNDEKMFYSLFEAISQKSQLDAYQPILQETFSAISKHLESYLKESGEE